jgi:hypothetical protein|tara:strand:- start:741 stop:1010 length:270 start_codon:yes stop_codon:yes gene_type:complete
MIRFADDFNSNNDDRNEVKKSEIKKIKKILKAIFNSEGFHEGAFKESATLVDLVKIVDEVLLQKNNNSINIIIDRNANNSLDILIKEIS